ncbi:NAD(+) diphosphatase [Dongia sp.]|uniref:NAD(+) diphosphatase n=1 Tax=Dongia sp. TaxID=1977262 RepID=UPI0035B41E6E
MHTLYYATGDFDRSAGRREDQLWLRARLQDPNSRLYPLWRLRHLIAHDVTQANAENGGIPRAMALDMARHGDLVSRADTIILLGVDGEVAHFALDLSGLDEASIAPLGEFQELRSIGALMPQREGALLAYARGLSYWHQRHRYCGACGARTEVKAAGHQRQCTNHDCSTVQFPRTDPAVIMRVTCGNKILMARQTMWAPGMHSVLAGFVEPGESLEDAVIREVYEEVGLRVHNVRYFASQPWPFPASLMLGFTAEAESEDFHLQDGEIEAARWMTRLDLLNSPENDDFRLPRADSISRRLIEDWVRL